MLLQKDMIIVVRISNVHFSETIWKSTSRAPSECIESPISCVVFVLCLTRLIAMCGIKPKKNLIVKSIIWRKCH